MRTKTYTTSDYQKLAVIFGPNIPIIEATLPLRLEVMPHHANGAVESDGLCCVLAKALGGASVAVLRCKTYILTERGRKTVVMKYSNGESAAAFIQLFDRGVRLTKSLLVEFLPIPPTHKRVFLQARHRERMVEKGTTGKVTRAYTKPSTRVIQHVEVQRGRRRVLITDGSYRCAVRYKALAA